MIPTWSNFLIWFPARSKLYLGGETCYFPTLNHAANGYKLSLFFLKQGFTVIYVLSLHGQRERSPSVSATAALINR